MSIDSIKIKETTHWVEEVFHSITGIIEVDGVEKELELINDKVFIDNKHVEDKKLSKQIDDAVWSRDFDEYETIS